MDTIVVLDGYTLNPNDQSWDDLHSCGEVHIYDRTSPEDVITRAHQATILVVNKVKITKQVLEQLPQLKYITVSATGYNNIDIEAADQMGVAVSNVVGYSTSSVAQHVFSLLLNVTNDTARYTQEVKEGAWSNQPDFSYWSSPIIELAGKTLGVYGLGDIGTAVVRIAAAYGMNIMATTRTEKKMDGISIDFVPIEELFESSDVISLHAPLTQANTEIVNADLLSKMKQTAILINTARGQLIQESDLHHTLQANRIHAACLDVLSEEPPVSTHPLFSLDNCFITPHQAWGSIDSRVRLMQGVVQNIKAFQNGMPQNIISFEL